MGGKHSVDVSSSRKRQRDVSVHSCEAGTLNVEEEGDKDPETPSLTKRRNIRSTSEYIYSTLFKGGINSDVTITALNKEWKVHKLYLSQSLYFRSMFSGQWKESDEPLIQLNIPDENVDVEALDLALSSLYKDEVELTPSRICPTLAAASLLQLDGLKEHCVQFMKDNLKCVCFCFSLLL
jgi:BTB/POZ domain-containing protein 13